MDDPGDQGLKKMAKQASNFKTRAIKASGEETPDFNKNDMTEIPITELYKSITQGSELSQNSKIVLLKEAGTWQKMSESDQLACIQEQTNNTGQLSQEEHQRFLEALRLFGKDWCQVHSHVGTRDISQIKSHEQKFK